MGRRRRKRKRWGVTNRDNDVDKARDEGYVWGHRKRQVIGKEEKLIGNQTKG